MKGKHSVLRIVRPLEQRFQFKRLNRFRKRVVFRADLFKQAFVILLVRHFDQGFQVVRPAGELVILFKFGGHNLHALVDLVGVLHILPKAFRAHLFFQLPFFFA